MNPLAVFSLSATLAVALASLPGSIVAQQRSLKEQLIGAWTLVSCEVTRDGAKQPYCADSNPNGILIFDASGRYATMTAARGRPKFTGGGNRSAASAEEYKAAAMGLVANFGTWSVNEADKTLAQHYEGALFPNVEGVDVKSTVSLSGDELKLITPIPASATDQAVWRRAK
jgi:hypothetical protein